jgi:SAM-dependent MidA family methyltransferase
MSSLSDRLRQRIQSQGAISFHDFMEAALYDDEDGYYCRERQRWGRTGDYRTSPERSVLFAATFARYFATLFDKLGSPADLVLVEAGAGSGEFIDGVLETLSLRFPEVFKATRCVIDERGSASRAVAHKRLQRFGDRVGFARIADLSVMSSGIIFSNELLDAIPVHRVIMKSGDLLEFFVETDDAGEFQWTLRSPSSKRLEGYFADAGIGLAEGQIAEVNLGIDEWVKLMSTKLQRGYVVTVDYGAEKHDLYSDARRSGTLRAFEKHQLSENILDNPGSQDITTTVNWTQVKRIGEEAGLRTIELERQDRFLIREGFLEELEQRVLEAADEAERLSLKTNAREMILPSGMAASFQVLVQEKR